MTFLHTIQTPESGTLYLQVKAGHIQYDLLTPLSSASDDIDVLNAFTLDRYITNT